MGHMFLNDWTHETADAMYTQAQTSGPPTLDNGLINGTNTYDEGGSRFEVSVTEGESYRIRLVNGAIDTHFKVCILCVIVPSFDCFRRIETLFPQTYF